MPIETTIGALLLNPAWQAAFRSPSRREPSRCWDTRFETKETRMQKSNRSPWAKAVPIRSALAAVLIVLVALAAAPSAYAVQFTGSSTLTAATYGTPYTATISINGNNGGSQISISSGALPAGLTLNHTQGQASATITGTPTATAGTYTFRVRATGSFNPGGTTTAFRDYSITVNRAPLAVAASPATRVYGAANPPLNFNTTGLRNADTPATVLTGALATTATAASPVGNYPINQGTLALSTFGAARYTLTFTGSTLGVTAAPLTVTADPQSRAYGAANPALTFTPTGLANGDTIANVFTGELATTAAAASPVGDYPITQGTLALSAFGNARYTLAFTDGTLEVTPAELEVTADPQSRAYGAANPDLTYTVTGLANGETAEDVLTGDLATTAEITSPVGDYQITQGTLAASANYTITFIDGNLEVTPAELEVTPEPQSRAYGAANPNLTYTVTGLANGETAEAVLSGALATTAAAASPVGEYPITRGTLAASANYIITFTDGTLEVTPAELTVTANDVTRRINTPNPAFSVSYSGFVNGEDPSVLGGTLEITTAATDASPAGEYDIVPSGLTSSNYAITFVNGTLTVTDREVPDIAWPSPGVITYGTPLGAAQLNATASFNDQPVPGTFTYTPAAGTILPAGADQSLQVLFTPDDTENFAPVTANETIDVIPADLLITANDATRRVGAANPTFGVSYEGFVNGEDASVLGGTLEFTTTATAASPAGEYDIVPSGLTSSNYDITFVNGTLTVIERDVPAIAWAAPAAITYGTPLGAAQLNATASFNGQPVPGTFTYTPTAGTVLPAGAAQTLEVVFTPTDSVNFAPVTATRTITVNRAALTITANNATRAVGAANPTFSVSYAGFVNGENASALSGTLSITTTATATSPAGTYPIVPSGLTSSNYTITFVNGTLTVTPVGPAPQFRLFLPLLRTGS
jgi:hypothetical protein